MGDALQSFTIEAWTYLGIDMVVIFTRLVARWRTTGLRNMSVDDFLMAIALLLYIAETATAHYVGAYWLGLANSGITDEQRDALDPNSHEYYLRVKGSQTQVFGWLVYTCLLWCLKLSWLFFYKRLGDGVNNMMLKIKIGFAFVGFTFFGTFFTILFGCFPISKHWQISPNPGNFCQPAVSKLQAWTLIVTNLATDFYLMTIPLPKRGSNQLGADGVERPHLRVKENRPRRHVLRRNHHGYIGGLRCGFILQDSENGPQLAGEWSCRESFVAVFISNVPVLFPIIHRSYHQMFQVMPSHTRSHSGRDTKESRSGGGSSGVSLKLSVLSDKNHDKKKFKHPLSLPGDTFYERYGSEDVGDGQPQTESKESKETQVTVKRVPDNITVTTEWCVKSWTTELNEREQELRRAVNGFQAR